MIAVGLLALMSLALATVLARALASGRLLQAMDHPNERSLHEVPTPRTGGIAIVGAASLGLLLQWLAGLGPGAAGALLLAAAMVFAISLFDDVKGLPIAPRLAVHVVAAAILIGFGPGDAHFGLPFGVGWSLPHVLHVLVLGLLVVWLVNLYNFMDGMDGFAGGMGVIGFATYGALGMAAGDIPFATTCFIVAAACAGFLTMNFPPARLFMGDAGASVLGLLAAGLALEASSRGLFALWLGMLVFSPFIVDATITLARRVLSRAPFWRAHREHFYQRLVALGWGHRRTSLHGYALMLGCAATALVVRDATSTVQAAAILGWAGVYLVVMAGVTRLERREAPP